MGDKTNAAANNSSAETAEKGEKTTVGKIETLPQAILDLIDARVSAAIEQFVPDAVAAGVAQFLTDPATVQAVKEAAIEGEEQRRIAEAARAAEDAARAEEAAEAARRDAALQRANEKRSGKADYDRAKKALRKGAGEIAWPKPGEGKVRLRLADGRSFLFGHSREVEADAFDTRNGDAIYAFPVEPDPEGEKGHATEAWLVVTDATNAVVAAARADLGAGIDIGGGSHSLIPARHLAF